MNSFQGLADFGGELLAQFGVAEALVAVEIDFREARFALNDVGQNHALGRRFRRGHADVIEQAGRVEVAHVVVEFRPEVLVADLDADIGANELVADRGGPDVLYFYLGNLA